MAVDAGRYPRRGRWQNERAAKERRQKQILAGATVLLAIVLAFQLPRILHRGGSASPAKSPTATPAPGEAATGPTATPATQEDFATRMARLRAFGAKDPFVTRGGATAATPAGLRLASGPWVRATHFVVKDPFVMRVAGSAPARHVAPRPHRRTPLAGRREYVVVLASIPIREGYEVAARIARIARERGIASARVLESSSYRSLRQGFYVVSGGTYRTQREAWRGLDSAYAHGFQKAYTRPLRH
jgi:hypothetical protein